MTSLGCLYLGESRANFGSPNRYLSPLIDCDVFCCGTLRFCRRVTFGEYVCRNEVVTSGQVILIPGGFV